MTLKFCVFHDFSESLFAKLLISTHKCEIFFCEIFPLRIWYSLFDTQFTRYMRGFTFDAVNETILLNNLNSNIEQNLQ